MSPRGAVYKCFFTPNGGEVMKLKINEDARLWVDGVEFIPSTPRDRTVIGMAEFMEAGNVYKKHVYEFRRTKAVGPHIVIWDETNAESPVFVGSRKFMHEGDFEFTAPPHELIVPQLKNPIKLGLRERHLPSRLYVAANKGIMRFQYTAVDTKDVPDGARISRYVTDGTPKPETPKADEMDIKGVVENGTYLISWGEVSRAGRVTKRIESVVCTKEAKPEVVFEQIDKILAERQQPVNTAMSDALAAVGA